MRTGNTHNLQEGISTEQGRSVFTSILTEETIHILRIYMSEETVNILRLKHDP